MRRNGRGSSASNRSSGNVVSSSRRSRRARRPGASRLLDERAFDAAQWTPGDGRIDIVELLHGYLDAAARRGARLKCGITVRRLLVESGRCVGVDTNFGEIRAETVVNAAGGWANRVARGAADPSP